MKKKAYLLTAWIAWAIFTLLLFKWVGVSMGGAFEKAWMWIISHPKELIVGFWGILTATLYIYTMFKFDKKENPTLSFTVDSRSEANIGEKQ